MPEEMEQAPDLSALLVQQTAALEGLSLRLSALETSQAAVQIPTVSEAEAAARTAEAEAMVKMAKIQAETSVEMERLYQEGQTERAEIAAEAVQEQMEQVAEIAEETGEVVSPQVIADQSPGNQLPTTNSPAKSSFLERLLLGR